MQIGTNLFYTRASGAMDALSERADTLNVQISTGKKLQQASDDSVAYQRLAGLKRAGADDTAYGANLTIAGNVLQLGDSTLSSITSQLQRASELAVSAASGTLNAGDKKAIGEELAGILQSLVALANTKDLRGQPLFGGDDGGAAVTLAADGTATLADTPVSAIPIGDGQSVQANETAARTFRVTGTSGATDVFAIVGTLAAALTNGTDTDVSAQAAIGDLQAAATQVTGVQSSLGARASRVELQQGQLTTAATDREEIRASVEDTDVTAAITNLQKTMTILSATQASFSKLSNLSLFDYLK